MVTPCVMPLRRCKLVHGLSPLRVEPENLDMQGPVTPRHGYQPRTELRALALGPLGVEPLANGASSPGRSDFVWPGASKRVRSAGSLQASPAAECREPPSESGIQHSGSLRASPEPGRQAPEPPSTECREPPSESGIQRSGSLRASPEPGRQAPEPRPRNAGSLQASRRSALTCDRAASRSVRRRAWPHV